MALSNNNKVFHSPAWYYTKTKDEYFTSPLVKTMLQNDAGDMWDNKATDEENITFYEELWNDEIAFFEYHGQQDVYEILLKDMKELDIIAYNELKGEIESSETYYDELIEKIARDILNGSQNLLLQKLKQIRKNDESGKAYNKKQRAKDSLRLSYKDGVAHKLTEKKQLFNFKMPFGCDEDWQKEINHHSVVLTLLEGVKEKMKQIIDIEKNTINKVMAMHEERLNELLNNTNLKIDGRWVNRITLATIHNQNQYQKNKAIVHKKFLENTEDNEAVKKRITDIITENNTIVDTDGFE